MPNYEKHMRLTIWICVAILLIAYSFDYLSTEVVIFVCATLCTAKYISPDLDMKGTIPTKSWGIFKPMLYPYRKIPQERPAHRGISHHPIWGPLTLIPYTFACFGIVVAAFIVFVLPFLNDASEYLCSIGAGMLNGTMPPTTFLIGFSIVIAAAVLQIEVHIVYDRLEKEVE